MAARKQQKRPRYSPHPGLGMEARALERLQTKTGKSFAQWTAIARRARIDAPKELQRWLCAEHGHGSRDAWWIASAALAPDEPDYGEPEALVDELYSGARAGKRALHERLVDEFLALGDDVLVTACKTMVPIYRKFVFADLRPVAGGIAVAMALGDARTGARLKAAAGRAAGDRITRAVVVGHEDEIDDELRGWLAQAYAAGAKAARRSTEFEVPRAFTAALRKSAAAAKTWKTCTPAMQRDMVAWVTEAKQSATRAKRLATAIGKLAAGNRRVY
jgi:hypothetical protein